MKIIKNIQSLSVAELLYELYYAREFYFYSKLDFNNHIRKNTDGFNKSSMFLLYIDLSNFIESEIEIIYPDNEKYNLYNIFHHKPQCDYIEYKGITYIDDENPIDNLISMAYTLIQDNDNLNFEYEEGSTQVMEYYLEFKDIADELGLIFSSEKDVVVSNVMYFTRENRGTNNITPIKFEDLFKKEYRDKEIQYKFIQWLRKEGYLNLNNEITKDKTNFARIYYLLRENGITVPNINHTKTMEVYFGKFGVEVVESINPSSETIQVLRRSVASKETRISDMLEMTDKEKNTLLSIFKPN